MSGICDLANNQEHSTLKGFGSFAGNLVPFVFSSLTDPRLLTLIVILSIFRFAWSLNQTIEYRKSTR
ncbi:uncharacterized protein PHALS_15329 [Plasmopara halstedii]|uniref:Uncharacterized protein n=1 Tax=Plasmopara halstedii TaxID=4781 RepID=A0A0P1ACK6_PLAHL|nr:uncharacterized protein PHALS_15329 [Plasmopara halstedii]CEG38687.1 hypothetical protein PHALS_15329 [Plasmopara halstedii]|eukprot:XP_024575056.1 hypothetical protein PHALS_15329 [Plasmopara halstedii]